MDAKHGIAVEGGPPLLETAHGPLPFPCFLPDATRAAVRAAGADDLDAVGVEALMVNALHLSSRPGTSLVRRVGGIHRFMGWTKPVASDSGGFQVYSLVTKDPRLGSISKRGFAYRLDRSGEKELLTPEKCIRKQFELGADILFCLDVCTHPDAGPESQRESVDLTIAWAKTCRREFDERSARIPAAARPKLFAVVQGGGDRELRRRCAEGLVEIGFDGYGFGGWPIGEDGRLVEAVSEVAALVPPGVARHALGIGKPENVVAAFRAGYDLFDCSLPTRDARRLRLYAFCEDPASSSLDGDSFYEFVYLQDDRHAAAAVPIDPTCDCPCCRRWTRAYLHHLFRVEDPLAPRLATLHNLRFYVRLFAALRKRRGAP